MKKLLTIAVLFLGLAIMTGAQTPYTCQDNGPCWTPAKTEMFVGVSYAFDNTKVATLLGASGDVAYFPFKDSASLIKGLGFAGDFGWARGDEGPNGKERLFTAMAGPRYRYVLGDGWSVFGQGLVGVTNEKFQQEITDTYFLATRGSYLLGVGLDAQFAQHISIRFMEYAYENTFTNQKSHSRISMGVKFSF